MGAIVSTTRTREERSPTIIMAVAVRASNTEEIFSKGSVPVDANTAHPTNLPILTQDIDFSRQSSSADQQRRDFKEFFMKCNIKTLSSSLSIQNAFLRYMEFMHEDRYKIISDFIVSINRDADVADDEPFMVMLVLQTFPCFLNSSDYLWWTKCRLQIIFSMDPVEEEDAMDSLFSTREPTDLQAIKNLLMTTTVRRIPLCESLIIKAEWFYSFIEVVETLPICVYLSLPDQLLGFPIIYANKCMEETSGQMRIDTLGMKNIYFEPTTSANKYSIEALQWSLLSGLPARANISCIYGEGEMRNVTVLSKPLLDTMCNHRYVISLQTEDSSEENLQKLCAFLLFVPSIIYE